jgi:hypothetical protein
MRSKLSINNYYTTNVLQKVILLRDIILFIQNHSIKILIQMRKNLLKNILKN